jgi:transposase InsO family protein
VADWEDRALEIAALRYRIIAEAAEVEGDGVSSAIKVAAREEYRGVDDMPVKVTARTLWRWLAAYRSGGLRALMPKQRSDTGQVRSMEAKILERAAQLRRENHERPTKTIIDILEREKRVNKGAVKRSTLDRHLDHQGLSRRRLHRLGRKTYRKVLTEAPLELVVADFHHGPYGRLPHEDKARKALLLAFIDHYSRDIIEGRYYLHENFAALRFGFRRVLLIHGLMDKLYVDNGPSFQAGRFHAACKNEALDIALVHSKPYVSEGRGVCERFNETVKYQFESEVRHREELLLLDELNAYFEAWLAERYRVDVHSETREPPGQRFKDNAKYRSAPDLSRLDELLRLRKSAKVHKKWSTVSVDGIRFVVDPSLRGRRVHVLYDPFDMDHVLVEYDGRIIQRAKQQKAGEQPPQLDEPEQEQATTDYLAMLRGDYEKRKQRELQALDMVPRDPAAEMTLDEIVRRLEDARGKSLRPGERTLVTAFHRKMRPIEPAVGTTAMDSALRRLGEGLHVQVYLSDLENNLVRRRTEGGKK